MALEGPEVADHLQEIPETLLALLRTTDVKEVDG
jgi:hypothetical protein